MAYTLFILVNAVLFLRPAEIIPAIEGAPIYEALILLCFVAALPSVLEQLRTDSLVVRPITLCVLLMFPAVILSHLSHMFLWGVRMSGFDYLKLIVYFLLLVGVVNTPQRLRSFTLWIGRFTVLLTVLSLLHHYGLFQTQAIQDAVETQMHIIDPVTGVPIVLRRLSGMGIFNNPNDLARMLIIGIVIAAWALFDPRGGVRRFLWLPAMLLLGFALSKTYSRGAFLALLSAVGVFSLARFGWRKSLVLAPLGMAMLFVAYSGRQTEISTDAATAQNRVELWSEGFYLLKHSLLFGIGMDQYGEKVGHVAHNSFVQCFVELGLVGGTIFAGAFYIALWGMWRVAKRRDVIDDDILRRMNPYVLSMVAGYVVGMLSSTRSYIVTTYMVLGIGAAFLNLVQEIVPLPSLKFSSPLVRRMVVASALLFVATYLYIRMSGHVEYR